MTNRHFARVTCCSLLGAGLAVCVTAHATGSMMQDNGLSTQAEPAMPPVTATPQSQARTAQIHAILQKYGLKCGNPACPICYPQTAPSRV